MSRALSRHFPKTLLLTLAATAALAACKRDAEAPQPAAEPQKPAGFAFKAAMTPADFAEHVRVLASDEFEGRAPGTAGEEKTVEYLKAQFQRMGLKPGNGDSWFQTVPMLETTAHESAAMTVDVKGKPHTLAFGTDMVIGTRTGQPEVKIDASDMVFVGYGVDAPEQKWNDYAGIDVKGKTVVMFVNDPGFHAKDATLFDGKRMTYYGRWTYKFEEAGRKGAAAALIIHDTEGASYGWDVVKNSWSGAQYDLRAADDPAPRVPLQGWITSDAAKALFADAGLDLDKMRAAAGKRGFKPMPLPAKASVTLKSTIAEKESRNVLALLPGAETPNEAIVYMAHWDHLGNHAGEKNPDGSSDVIYNGAIDNATGVAGILEIAELLASGAKPKRSVLFAAVTLEESGLLGSKYYVAHPSIPLAQTVGVINLDAMSVAGRSRDITVVGMGNSGMEDILKPIAERQGRKLVEESNPAGGYYFRSDHFNFAKAGVPALYPDGGTDLLEGGTAAGDAAGKIYNENHYHKPSDQYDPATWKLDGTMQDLAAVYEVGLALAFGDTWPNWYDGNPFRAARDRMMAAKPPAPAPTATPAQ